MTIICGVDVSKNMLDAAIEPGGAFGRFANDAKGIADLAAFCRRHKATMAVMEASGGYEKAAYASLWDEGIPCVLTNPKRVRDFAKSRGILEKTDRIDAHVIANFALANRLVPMRPPSPVQERLTDHVKRLRQLTADITVEKQRRAHLPEGHTMRAHIDAHLAYLKSASRALEGEIASMIDDDPLWSRLARVWRGEVKGVASRTVAWLHALLPEIGIFSNKAIAKIAGLAPIANDSGSRKGRRHIRGGRGAIRSILFLVAAIAARHDKGLAAFRDKLLAAGKEKMVVRIALARKLLVRLNAKARDARVEHANAT